MIVYDYIQINGNREVSVGLEYEGDPPHGKTWKIQLVTYEPNGAQKTAIQRLRWEQPYPSSKDKTAKLQLELAAFLATADCQKHTTAVRAAMKGLEERHLSS